MSVCFNTIHLTAPTVTTNQLLAKGFGDCEYDDWGFCPQQFSFIPFLEATCDKADVHSDNNDSIWTNWIDRQAAKNGQKLMIEFESEHTPAINAVNALIKWLNEENLNYDLKFQYRQENERWQGELNAKNPH
jgi:hypothetical protein